jgi:predicted aminopeptidase
MSLEAAVVQLSTLTPIFIQLNNPPVHPAVLVACCCTLAGGAKAGSSSVAASLYAQSVLG